MNYFIKIVIVVNILFSYKFMAQTGATCATAINTGTPNGTSTCYFQSNGTTGSSPCSGGGYGGTGGVTFFKFCTNASASCVAFDVTNGTASGSYEYDIYDASCAVILSTRTCAGVAGTGTEYSTAGKGLLANTCYYLRVWSGNPGSLTICTNTAVVANDACAGPQQISTTAISGSNLCATAVATDPPPAQFAASSLQNDIWYSFTTNTVCVSSCTVVVSITNISCISGGAGFQIGYWTGSCVGTSTAGLSNLGSISGSGGTVTTTITGLTGGQKILIGMDGNSGANCTFSISASNTQPLPVDLIYFYGYQKDKANYLEWASITETNVDYFIIDKSDDGINYRELNRVKAAGNSLSKKVYSTIDENARNEFTYYKLTSIDLDKTSKVFNIVSVNNPNHHRLFDVYPNPGSGDITVSFDERLMSNKRLIIYDYKGNMIKELYFTSSDNSKIDISDLKKGIYNINFISDSGDFQTLKFIKD